MIIFHVKPFFTSAQGPTVKDNGFYYSNSNLLNHFWITLETEYESLFLNETLLTTGVDIIEMQDYLPS